MTTKRRFIIQCVGALPSDYAYAQDWSEKLGQYVAQGSTLTPDIDAAGIFDEMSSRRYVGPRFKLLPVTLVVGQ